MRIDFNPASLPAPLMPDSAFSMVVEAIDYLEKLEAGIDSIAAYQQQLAENASDVAVAHRLLTEAGRIVGGRQERRDLLESLISFGYSQKSHCWISLLINQSTKAWH